MRYFLCIWVLLALAGCSPSNSSEPLTLKVAGATFPASLYESWSDEYRRANPDVDVRYEAVGSSEGIARFLAESVDIGASDAALTDEQLEKVSRGPLMIPMTAGSISIAYNPEGLPPEGVKLSRDVYSDIFLGKITNWNDPSIAKLNPTLAFPDLPIVVVVRSDGSGTTFAFTNHLSAISDEWKNGPGVGRSVEWPKADRSASGNNKVAREIQITKGALAYLEFGVASRAKLAMATLENKAGQFVAPSGHSGLETLLEAEMPPNLRAFFPDPAGSDAYPIVTFTWMLAYEEYDTPQRANAVRKFLHWCLTDGQSQNEGLGYIRLSPRVAKVALEAIEKIKS